MIKGDFEPHFSLKNMLKDARYAQQLAVLAGVSERVSVLDATAAAMQARAASNGANGAVGRPIDQRVEFRVLGAAT
jgi:3-hydroxyisobutyrate dehydrogenase-like beta-hydroxyacid dehydrogenase